MPWHIARQNDRYCVIKDADNSTVACHDKRVDAIKNLRALYASESDSTMIADAMAPSETILSAPPVAAADCSPGYHKMPNGDCMPDTQMPAKEANSYGHRDVVSSKAPWEGVLTMEGVESGDGREFAVNSLTWDTTPADGMPLMWQKETSHGGQGDVSVRVGSVTQAWREPDPAGRANVSVIKGRGFIDLGNSDGAEVHRRMQEGFLSGNSVDVDSVKDANVEFVYDQNASADGQQNPLQMFAKPALTRYHKGRIRGTTLVEFPAFTEARLSLTNDQTAEQPMNDEISEPLVAATHVLKINDAPPREWFQEPRDVIPQGALTITDEGRVYGYLAPAGVQHRSFVGKKDVFAPAKNVDYSRFMSGETIVADGGRVVTGPITMGCGHETTSRYVSASQAQEHYDNSCSLFASVVVGENKNGTWFAGALLPDVTAAQVQRAMQCKLSGDWRPHGDQPGWRELTAALLVPTPGFPMARSAPSVQYENEQLVASSVPVRFAQGDAELIQTELSEEDQQALANRAIAMRIAKSIGCDTKSKVNALRTKLAFRDFSTDERKKLASSGAALPDGSYPIVTVSDLHNAIQAYGRSNPSDRARVKAHIIKRAKALGATSALPEDWVKAEAVLALRARVEMKFDPKEPRDANGQWTSGPGGVIKKIGRSVKHGLQDLGGGKLFDSLDKAVEKYHNDNKSASSKQELNKVKESLFHRIKGLNTGQSDASIRHTIADHIDEQLRKHMSKGPHTTHPAQYEM